MAKNMLNLVLSDKAKDQTKITKAIESDSLTCACWEAFRQEAASGTTVELPNVKLIITDNYLCWYSTAIKLSFRLIPITSIMNLYRTNMIDGNYDYGNFRLALELSDGSRLTVAPYARSKKTLDVYEEAIRIVREKMSLRAGGIQA